MDPADHTKCVILPLTPGQFDFEDELGRRVLRAVTLFQEHRPTSPGCGRSRASSSTST